jgi:SAM-dependent methyltransferase
MQPIEQVEAFYRGEFRLPNGEVMAPPWEIDELQAAVPEFVAAGALRGRVLDAGCGTGRHAVYLTEAGFDVTGFDFSPTAIERAGRRAADAGSPARFVVADATDLSELDGPFDTVIDIGLFHFLPAEAQHRYATALHAVTSPDATVHIVYLSASVSIETVRTAFAGGWQVPDPVDAFLRGRLPEPAASTGWNGAELEESGLHRIPAALVSIRRV